MYYITQLLLVSSPASLDSGVRFRGSSGDVANVIVERNEHGISHPSPSAHPQGDVANLIVEGVVVVLPLLPPSLPLLLILKGM